jgi:MerR family transcriptional regulator, thiopeptide resistance regulator
MDHDSARLDSAPLHGARLDIAEVARLAGVTSRTLRHYDAIGLVQPAGTDRSGRRWYGRAELLRLQRVLVLRAMGLPLERIAAVLDEDLDELEALKAHREGLRVDRARLDEVLATVQRTIDHLEGRNDAMTAKDVFAGLPGYDEEKQRAYEVEARERWGDDAVDASAQRARALTPDQAADHQREHESIAAAVAACAAAGATPDDAQVQEVIARHHAWVSVFWIPDADAYTGLGRMYVEDDRFRATYDAFGPGTTDLLAAAMESYADTVMR